MKINFWLAPKNTKDSIDLLKDYPSSQLFNIIKYDNKKRSAQKNLHKLYALQKRIGILYLAESSLFK